MSPTTPPRLPPRNPSDGPIPRLAGASPKWFRVRMGALYVVVCASFALVSFRLVQLQVMKNPELAALAQKQFQKVGKVAPYRQPIYDRNREELAVSIPSSSVFARPKQIRARRRTARVLARILGGTPQRWLSRLDPRKSFVWVHRQLGAEQAKKLARHNLPGVFIESENKRIYPNGNLAAQVVGFTDIDGNGLSGLELSLNRELLEKEARFPLPRDGKGNPSYIDRRYISAEEARRGVYVTLDRRLQNAVEEELQKTMEETGAKGAYAVVMDPYTGEVFALGQLPGFDPNFVREANPATLTNRFISHLFEPGSILKPLFAAEAIQSGVLTADSLVDCGLGKIQIGRDTIHEAEAREKYGLVSVLEMLRVSSNVGAVRVALKLGPSRMAAALERFGLTARTGISLPGEASGTQKTDGFWKVPVQLATTGFGQGLAITPLQMVASYAPFANGGYLVRPRILLRETSPNSGERLDVRRVLSPQTVIAMRRILSSVTEKGGTGVSAAIPGIRVAGKTGTAQKYEPGAGYGGGKYFSSFVGFLPADRPELLVGVMVDEPKSGYYAAQVAAPLFKRIAERGLQILDRVPKQSLAAAKARAVALRAAAPGVVAPEPAAPAATAPAELVDVSEGKWVMPDLKGTSLREALRSVGKYLNNVKVQGSGYLDAQQPKAGTVVGADTLVSLHFAPAG